MYCFEENENISDEIIVYGEMSYNGPSKNADVMTMVCLVKVMVGLPYSSHLSSSVQTRAHHDRSNFHAAVTAICSSYNTASNKMERTRLVNRVAFQNLVIPR